MLYGSHTARFFKGDFVVFLGWYAPLDKAAFLKPISFFCSGAFFRFSFLWQYSCRYLRHISYLGNVIQIRNKNKKEIQGRPRYFLGKDTQNGAISLEWFFLHSFIVFTGKYKILRCTFFVYVFFVSTTKHL